MKVQCCIRKSSFDPQTFLSTIRQGRRSLHVGKKKTIFAQDDVTDAVFHIEKGEVKLTVASSSGKEATIGILGDGDIFGEGYPAGQPVCTGSASAMIKCEILRIGKKAMMLALHREHKLSGLFVAYLLARNIRDREDLVGQLFNSSGKTIGEDSSVVGALRHERVSRRWSPESVNAYCT
jgi:CRP/FNR family transcriptional regulator, cyclic AMP receptor protein